MPPPLRRVAAGLAAVVAVAAAFAGFTAPAQADPGAANTPTTNPYSPAYQHPYRHGAVPTIETQRRMDSWAASDGMNPSNVGYSGQLSYHGGVDGIGVTTGKPKVYLVFYGNQWGTAGTDANGNTTFSGDSYGMAPRLQQLFRGIGTNNEQWSGVMTQYCEGISVGGTSCPSGSAYEGYPLDGALAGVWYDNSVASPSVATGHQLAQEAVNAAAHFGNTTAAANRDAQYFIVSPHGTRPDGFPGTYPNNWCAWHDWNGDASLDGGPVSSAYGDIAFTNSPYLLDADSYGVDCGRNFVNSGSAGTLDGVTMMAGHEYAEVLTDQNFPGGWLDANGWENADKCAWLQPGSGTGAAANVTFSTGTFAMQTTYSNEVSDCQMYRATAHFSMSLDETSGQVNPGGTVSVGVRTAYVSGGLYTPIDLVASGVSPRMTVTFSPNPVQPGDWSFLDLDTNDAPPGTYTVHISGSNGTETHTGTYTLTVGSTQSGTTSACGETTCAAVQQAGISYFVGSGCTGSENYWTGYNNSDGIRRSWDGTGIVGTALRTVTNKSYKSSDGVCHDAWPSGSSMSGVVTVYRYVCGETTCQGLGGAYISHYTGVGCTGSESYYTLYNNSDGIRRSWDGKGVAGTTLRTVTNYSYKTSDGVCHDAWPSGNTLSGFVTIYRQSCGELTCQELGGALISHFTELDCTGTESYYTLYNNSDGIRRSWDGRGLAGTTLRTVTNRSWKDSSGVCHNDWPDGNTLSGFVTIYR